MTRIQQFDFSVDLLQALLWQYNDALKLQQLLTDKQEWVNDNQTAFWQAWFTDVFNLVTANDFGLSVWSIILNIPLSQGPAPSTKKSFGFGAFRKNFNNGNFTRADSTIFLTREEKRLVLRLRYYQLISNGVTTVDNEFLKEVFKNFGTVYLLDSIGGMELVCVFKYRPSPQLMLILKKYDLIPRPSGVRLRFFFATRKTFGFGPYRRNFNNGSFNGEE
jgi:hypothetical protein